MTTLSKTKKRLLAGILVMAALAGGYWTWKVKFAPKPAQYTTEEVVRGDITRMVSATGTIQAVNTVTVGSQVSGTIRRIYVDYNSPVKKGQLIAEIDPALLSAQARQAEAELAQSRAGLSEAEASLREAEREYVRQKSLFASDFVAKSALDSAETSMATARARVESARAGIRSSSATLNQRRTNLGYTKILSPVDGVVTAKEVSEGQTVAASLSAPELFTIAEDLSKMQVEAAVDEADIGYVQEGMGVTFTVDTYPEDTFSGKVRQVRLSPSTTENVVTYTVIISAANPDLRLKPGMTANVNIETASAKNVLKVPNAALRFRPTTANGAKKASTSQSSPPPPPDGGAPGGEATSRKSSSVSGKSQSSQPSVWVLEQKKGASPSLRRVPVTVGLTDGTSTEVSGDLAEGEAVVTGALGNGSKGSSGGNLPRRMF
jgi:HlyD family secretion protein